MGEYRGPEVGEYRGPRGGEYDGPIQPSGGGISWPPTYNGIKLQPRIYTNPIIATNPVSGDAYITWNDAVHGPEMDTSHILFVRSTNKGASWSDPINAPRLTTNDQFMPWLCVNPAGNRISISYYDRSDFEDNEWMHVKVSTSIDGGVSFTAPVRITDADHPSRADVGWPSHFIGDYNGMQASTDALRPGKVFPVWADSRNGNFDIFSSAADVQIRLRDTIKYNSTLSGLSLGENDVTVASGVTLNVAPGSVYQQNNGLHLYINGKLSAKGTTAQRITFTTAEPIPGPGYWEGIYCLGGGPDTLTYCDIRYANVSAIFSNTEPNSYMFNDTISYASSNPVSVANVNTANTALTVYKCGIKNNQSGWISVNNAKVKISNSRIENNSRGVYVANAGLAYIDSSRIQNHILNGVEVTGAVSRLSLSPDEIKGGYNTLSQEGSKEVYVRSSGTAVLGYTASGLPRAGYNNITNSYTFTGRLVYNANATTQQARYNYWGTNTTNGFYGSVDTTFRLGSPVATPAKAEPVLTGREPNSTTINSTEIVDWIGQLKSQVEGDSTDAEEALYHLQTLAGVGGKYANVLQIPWEDFLLKIRSSTRLPGLRLASSALYIQSLMDEYRFDDAISAASDLQLQEVNDDFWQFCQTRRIFASAGKGDMAGAVSALKDLKTSTRELDRDAITAMEDYVALSKRSPISDLGISVGLVKPSGSGIARKALTYSLEQNYPNPFNPNTRIDYTLPESKPVRLVIYDVLGSEVTRLIDEVQSAGYKSVTFDASSLPSGVYFYQLQAGNFSQVNKMLLLK